MQSATLLARRPGVVLLALAAVAALLAGVLRADPAEAGTRVMPGSFTGFAFDACMAPTQEQMDVWLERSPYWGVGIYTAGDNRYCKRQPAHLDADWVSTQARKGWRLLPITVGRQASCSGVKRWTKVSADPTDSYAKARSQGREEAGASVRANKGYGIATGSTLWLDMESFDTGRTRCRESALAFVSAWTNRLHDLGFRSGFYSSVTTGIRMLDEARATSPRRYALPDQIWLADWDGRATARSSSATIDGWTPHRRIHQFTGGHDETWGGVKLNIDSNFMDVGRGSVAPKTGPHCGVRREFPSYRALSRGDRGDQVAALQCFLRQQRYGRIAVDGRFGSQTAAAVRRFQHDHGLRRDRCGDPAGLDGADVRGHHSPAEVRRCVRGRAPGAALAQRRGRRGARGHRGVRGDHPGRGEALPEGAARAALRRRHRRPVGAPATRQPLHLSPANHRRVIHRIVT